MKSGDPTFENMKISFRTDLNGNVAAVIAPFEPTMDPIVFARKPEARLFDPAYLDKVSGKYDLNGQPVTVERKGDKLTITVAGQPPYDLIPELGGEYSLKQVKSITMKFIEDAKGQVTAIEVYQPGGVFEAKRTK